MYLELYENVTIRVTVISIFIKSKRIMFPIGIIDQLLSRECLLMLTKIHVVTL